MVREVLEKVSGKRAASSVSTDEAVAFGAALAAGWALNEMFQLGWYLIFLTPGVLAAILGGALYLVLMWAHSRKPIAGAVLGGCALKGGEGSIVGILIGATILVLLSNVVNMLDQPSSLRDVITGGVLFVGVLLNQIGLARIKRLIGMGAKQPE